MPDIVEIKARLFKIQRKILEASEYAEAGQFNSVFDCFDAIEEHAQKGQAECLDN